MRNNELQAKILRLQKENEELKKKKDEYYLRTLDYETKISYLIQALEEIREIISGNYEILDPQAKQDIEKLIDEVTKVESEGVGW